MSRTDNHFSRLAPPRRAGADPLAPRLGLDGGTLGDAIPARRVFGNDDMDAAFMTAAVMLLEGDSGVLRYSNRLRLLELAARMGVGAFEANLLIERARFRAGREPSWKSAESSKPTIVTRPAGPDRRRTRWLAAAVLALAMDAALLIYLLLA